MSKIAPVLAGALVLALSPLTAPRADAAVPLPNSMAGLGDSITRAADVCCWYGDHPAQSWSTGNYRYDAINSHYERLAATHPAIIGHQYNDAASGAKARDLPAQASNAVAQKVDYVTIPNIYQLWSVLHTNWLAQLVWSTANICQSMLASTNTETQRQQVVARELAFNEILAQACAQYSNCRWDTHATYNYNFSTSQVSTLDYFHPSLSGQAALAQLTWNTSWWAS